MNSFLEKAQWYKRRLTSMSTAEVFHRLDEAVKRRLDQFSVAPNTKDLGPFKSFPFLRDRLDAIGIAVDILAQWRQIFTEVQKGNFFLLNRHWPAHAPEQRWHLDPVTEKMWPRDAYGFDINYRHNPDMGDIKYVWELNRLHYLQPIATLAYIERDAHMGRWCLQEIESWIDSNPPYRGINWVSGIELALRAVSILMTTTLVGEYLTSNQRAKIWGTMQAHGRWLERYPSMHSSANNHRTAEGLGLHAIGCLCPRLEYAEKWKNQGWEILFESAHTHILPDGVGAEQAVSYQEIVLEMLSIGQTLAASANIDFPDSYQQQIKQGQEFLAWITDDGGNKPHIGDDDNGFVIDASLRRLLFNRQSTPLQNGAKIFAQGGYSVGRHNMHGQNIMLAFDHGNLGYLSIAAHGHADALAVWLHIDDQPVFVDAGTYLYHSGGAERDAFRGTAAHNTLCLEDTNSSTIAGAFNWSHKANAKVTASQFTSNKWFVEAEHDGYQKQYQTLHRRRVDFNAETGSSITDQIIGGSAHHVEIGYLLHPDLTATQEAGVITINRADKILLRLGYDGPLKPEIRTNAWYSESFGIKKATTRIVYAGTLAPNEISQLQLDFSKA